ncbi:hypothetical protein NUU61_006455 [Penicillium alfredii]|uniref:TOG domain-containing protein n=1 Tax=Penicillium alfredii TaxID=1506179 RepID=A0A9W9F161_9EURO|nr:uncharacterized protein NUU61_006455 [Penicillium alfredii]KAJ5091585.1 hypothetical protein NUU61_006455 [Penicillium alfredii]
METKAADLLATFKNPNVSVDAKVAHLTSLKSDIKQKNVPDGAILTIFETLRLSLSSQHYSVLGAGFSTLGHFLKRLSIQDQQQWIVSQARNFYPVLMERLGDHKERVRAQSASIFTELWPVAGAEVEYCVLETALVGKNPRAKEMSLLWLLNMTKNHGLLFRQYVPSLVACLEDADSAVRDTAKLVVIELFRTAPARAKSDLQKQLVTRSVRKSIANAILSGIGLNSAEPESSSSTRPISRAERPISVMSSRSQAVEVPRDGSFAHSFLLVSPAQSPRSDSIAEPEPVKSRPGSSRSHYERQETPSVQRPHTPAEAPAPRQSSQEDDDVEPLLVGSARDIDDLMRDMIPWFDGRESEDNWMKREKNVVLFRRLTRGNAPHDFSQTFVSAIKTLLDGIFKVVNSLRTTLCTNGCLLIQDIAKTCGPKIDSMVEIIMQNLIKLCGALKKIAAQSGNATVDAVIGNVSFTTRILQHVHWASVDKNLGLRLFAAGWLKTLISRQAHHRSTVEHGGGLDLVEKSIKKGLGDANPGVREAMRSTFWTFYPVWPDKANAIMSDMDTKSRNLLEKDPANPNAGQQTSAPSRKGPSTPGGGRSALKEAIAARKKAQMPSRPESAQPTFTDVKKSDPAPKPAVRTVPTGAPLSSLSSAPMRPGAKPRRAELSRPATADPYARRPDSRAQSTKPIGSPHSVKSKSSTPSSKPLNAPRLRPHDSGQTGTTKGKPKKLDLSKSKSYDHLLAASRPRSDSNESITNQHSGRAQPSDPSSASEDHNSPASVVLKSPLLAASQPPLLHPEPSVSDHDARLIAVEEPHFTPLEEPNATATSPRAREEDVEVSPRDVHPPSVPEPVKSQPDSMVIYEDPATPVAVEAGSPVRAACIENLTPTKSSNLFGQREPREEEARSIPENAPAVMDSIPDLAPSQERVTDSPMVETQPRSPTRKTPLRESPSPSRTRDNVSAPELVSGVDSALPHEPVSGAAVNQTGNNENVTPHISKVADLPAAPRSAVNPNALEELPLNESTPRLAEARGRSLEPLTQAHSEDLPRRNRKWAERHRSISPRSKDPVNAKEMIQKAHGRIVSKTMDISGYRKLQGLFQYHGEEIVARTQDYYAVLEALLSELEAVPTNRKDHDAKTQILATIRSMLLRTREHFERYDILAMAAIIRARRHYESTSHFVTCLEEVTEQLVSVTAPWTAVMGVLQGLEQREGAHGEETYQSIIMGLSTIQQALAQPGVEISDDVLASVGTVVSQHLGHPRPGVRKNATELCTFLSLTFGSERVEKVTPPPQEGSLNLLTYFLARRSQ